jgi:uncharacterized protein (TIGR02599 family)
MKPPPPVFPPVAHRVFPRRGVWAFTILELLVAMAVLALLLVLLLGAISQTSSVTRSASGKVSAFQGARAGFDLLTRTLSQATLNSYWDYDNATSPTRYLRKSELHFLVGAAGTDPLPGTVGTGQAVCFQVPAGMTGNATHANLENLLNACGYFIQYGPTDPLPAPFPAPAAPTYRYQLMQAIEPSESLGVYGAATGNGWVGGLVTKAVPIAENIICLLVWPRKAPAEDAAGGSLTADFSYDSRKNALVSPQPETAHQMPPVVQITMVALDETSAARVCTGATPPTAVSGAFAGLFENSSQTDFEANLKELETRLAAKRLSFRVFTSTVPIRESKMQ